MSRIYLASPFFNEKQIERIEFAEKVLDDKLQFVFSPRKAQYEDLEFGSLDWRTEVYINNIRHIEGSDLVVAIYDEEDAGTMWEIGYAYALGKPVVVFSETGEPINLMISDSLHAFIGSREEFKAYNFNDKKPSVYKGEVF